MQIREAPTISDADGIAIVSAARRAVTAHLGITVPDTSALIPNNNSGVFVSIHKAGKLRGCIGFIVTDQKLSYSITEAAVAAATQDSRFVPMNPDELSDVIFEVTVLSVPEKLSAKRAEYPSEIIVGRDGLIIQDASHSGLLLPQVPVEFGWNSTEFLDQTCQKAGLDDKCWMDERVVVKRFSGTIFKEVAPNGQIVRS